MDRSFVKDLATDQNDRAIVNAMIAMTHEAMMAEGIEASKSSDSSGQPTAMRCQAFVFSRPLSAEGFVQFVERAAFQSH